MSSIIETLVVSVSHAGGEVPPAIRATLAQTDRQILANVDLGTAQIFGPLPAAAVIMARWSRLVVDLNRDPAQRDDKGVIARTDYRGRPVFRHGLEPDIKETERRIEAYYRPFHRRLSTALDSPGIRFLVEGHSLDAFGPADAPDPGGPRADVVISNRGDETGGPDDEVTCSPRLLGDLAAALQGRGLSVAKNFPYRGGFITRHWGPILRQRGGGAIQIEVNKGLFLDEPNLAVIGDRAADVRRRLGAALAETLQGWR
jgi:N-formylglutamate deformylase